MSPSQDRKRLKQAKMAYRQALRTWEASERAAQLRVGSGERKPETEALLRAAREDKWQALEAARLDLTEIETGARAAKQPLPPPREAVIPPTVDRVERRIKWAAFAVAFPLVFAGVAFLVLSADAPYSVERAARCVSDKGFAVGSPYELGGADFFVGSPSPSTASGRQFVVSVQGSEEEAVEWQGFWNTQASPSFAEVSLKGRSVVGWRYEPPNDEIDAVTNCLS